MHKHPGGYVLLLRKCNDVSCGKWCHKKLRYEVVAMSPFQPYLVSTHSFSMLSLYLSPSVSKGKGFLALQVTDSTWLIQPNVIKDVLKLKLCSWWNDQDRLSLEVFNPDQVPSWPITKPTKSCSLICAVNWNISHCQIGSIWCKGAVLTDDGLVSITRSEGPRGNLTQDNSATNHPQDRLFNLLCDGSFNPSSIFAGSGFILTDKRNNQNLARCSRHPPSSPLQAKGLAVLEGLKAAQQLNLTRIKIFNDSKSLINMLSNPSILWHLKSFWMTFSTMLRQLRLHNGHTSTETSIPPHTI